MAMTSGIAVEGVVREWHPEQGVGGHRRPRHPGWVQAHFSHVAIDGYRTLVRGQVVALEWETADQDGFRYRARRLWPTGAAPIDVVGETDTDALGSSVTLSSDQDQ